MLTVILVKVPAGLEVSEGLHTTTVFWTLAMPSTLKPGCLKSGQTSGMSLTLELVRNADAQVPTADQIDGYPHCNTIPGASE